MVKDLNEAYTKLGGTCDIKCNNECHYSNVNNIVQAGGGYVGHLTSDILNDLKVSLIHDNKAFTIENDYLTIT